MDPESTQGAKASPSAGHASTSHEPDEPQRSAEVHARKDSGREPAATRDPGAGESGPPAKRRRAKAPVPRENEGLVPNNVKRLRQAAMMSKAELARRAGVSPLTIDRVEAGCPCRMDTKRKILEALGLQPSAAKEVFPDEDLG
ncbi:MAG: helix-turn-helix domain-containing protein [Nannocystaceae bacterium]|nr:helix-turn-helix domain-containing protein [Nannocystaceae bacterium]